MMKNYEFPTRFRALYTLAVESYTKGLRSADAIFSTEDTAWLAANGITPQHMFDYAEDHNQYSGEPSLEHALGIELIRRDYFLNIQEGRASRSILDESKLPAKNESAQGIVWLPRLIRKTQAGANCLPLSCIAAVEIGSFSRNTISCQRSFSP